MTLAEVAARMRAGIEAGLTGDELRAIANPWAVLEAFEADPDFSLRERIEAIAREMDEAARPQLHEMPIPGTPLVVAVGSSTGDGNAKVWARKLRDLIPGPPPPAPSSEDRSFDAGVDPHSGNRLDGAAPGSQSSDGPGVPKPYSPAGGRKETENPPSPNSEDPHDAPEQPRGRAEGPSDEAGAPPAEDAPVTTIPGLEIEKGGTGWSSEFHQPLLQAGLEFWVVSAWRPGPPMDLPVGDATVGVDRPLLPTVVGVFPREEEARRYVDLQGRVEELLWRAGIKPTRDEILTTLSRTTRERDDLSFALHHHTDCNEAKLLRAEIERVRMATVGPATPEPPHRRFRLLLDLGGDSERDLFNLFDEFVLEVETHRLSCQLVVGDVSAGGHVKIAEDPSVTNESYHAAIRDFVARTQRPGGGA